MNTESVWSDEEHVKFAIANSTVSNTRNLSERFFGASLFVYDYEVA